MARLKKYQKKGETTTSKATSKVLNKDGTIKTKEEFMKGVSPGQAGGMSLEDTRKMYEKIQSAFEKKNAGEMKRGGMTNQDLNKIQAANAKKNIMFNVMKDAYDRRKKKRGGATKMGMGGTCPPKVIQGKSLR